MTDNIVPDGFDLDAARDSRSSTPTSQRACCPVCGSLGVVTKTDRPANTRTDAREYWCDKCHAHFDTPETVSDSDGQMRGGDSQ